MGSVIYVVLLALLALAVVATARDTAVSIGVVLTLQYLPRGSRKQVPCWGTPWGQDSR